MISFSELNTIDDTLRPYQQNGKKNIYNAFNTHRSVMFQMPTGTGKTRIVASIVRDVFEWGAKYKIRPRILILAHREELIEQMRNSLRFGYRLGSGMIKGREKEEPENQIQIASIASLSRRLSKWKATPFEIIIIDEAHHATASTYKSILKSYPNANVLGVTATPYRLSKIGFKSIFSYLVLSDTIDSFISNGYLSKYKFYSIPPKGDVQTIINSIDEFDFDGDYSERQLSEKCNTPKVRAKIIDAYLKYAKGEKGIVYTINREHNIQVCEDFRKIGVVAEYIDGNTPSEERKKKVSSFKCGTIDVLCNVNIFSEGFDCPGVEFILLARPTKSLSLYLQQVGRGFRINQNKKYVVFLDNVGAYNLFGLPSARRQWSRHFEGINDVDYTIPSTPEQTNDGSLLSDIKEGSDEMVLVYENEMDNDTDTLNNGLCLFEDKLPYPIDYKGRLLELEKVAFFIDHDQFTDDEKQRAMDFWGMLSSLRDPMSYATYNDESEWIEIMYDESHYPDLSDEQINNYHEYLNSVYKVKVNGLWGILDMQTQSYIVEPIYDEIIHPDSENNIICKKGDCYGVIDGCNGVELIPFVYDGIEYATKEAFIVRKANKFAIVNTKGVCTDFMYNSIEAPHIIQRYFFARQDYKYSLIDEDLNLINYTANRVRDLSKHKFAANISNITCHNKDKEIIVNEKNEILFPLFFDKVYPTTIDNTPLICFLVKGSGGGLLDYGLKFVRAVEKGELPIDISKPMQVQSPKAKNIIKINTKKENGIICNGSKFGYYLKGKEMLECKYDEIEQVKNNTLIVSQNKKYGVYKISKNGVTLSVPLTYDGIQFIKENYYIVSKYGFKGIINADRGNIRIVKDIAYSDIVLMENQQHVAICQNNHHTFLKISSLL